MKNYYRYTAGSALVLGLLVAGCGGGDGGDVSVAPPPASTAPVAMDATAPAAAPGAPAPAGTPDAPLPGTAAAIPAAQSGPTDMFKGMSQRDIDDFKSQATPETHDMNIGPIMEAITGFQAEFRRYPANMEELVKSRYLAKVLYAPKGKKYSINQKTGEVTAE